MSIKLQGLNTLVTGSTDGLGRLVALELAKHGANVIVHGRNSEKADLVLEQLKSVNSAVQFSKIICDLNHPDTIPQEFSRIGNLDILINNAGIWTEGETVNVSIEKIIEMTNINLTSQMVMTRTLLPVLSKSKFAQILNVISVAGEEVPADHFRSIYTATKFGLRGFTESLIKEFDKTNIRIMGIYPDRMKTGLFDKANINYDARAHRMFDPQEAVDSMIFMLTRNPNINIKRLDIINQETD